MTAARVNHNASRCEVGCAHKCVLFVCGVLCVWCGLCVRCGVYDLCGVCVCVCVHSDKVVLARDASDLERACPYVQFRRGANSHCTLRVRVCTVFDRAHVRVVFVDRAEDQAFLTMGHSLNSFSSMT